MEQINNRDLEKIYGGIGVWSLLGVVSAIIFIIGAVDGYVRPLTCRK